MNPQKDKGSRFERELVHLAIKYGLDAKRVPLSGAAEGYKGDVIIEGEQYECKCRANGFKKIYEWLEKENSKGLAIKADRKTPLMVIPMEYYVSLIQTRKQYLLSVQPPTYL